MGLFSHPPSCLCVPGSAPEGQPDPSPHVGVQGQPPIPASTGLSGIGPVRRPKPWVVSMLRAVLVPDELRPPALRAGNTVPGEAGPKEGHMPQPSLWFQHRENVFELSRRLSSRSIRTRSRAPREQSRGCQEKAAHRAGPWHPASQAGAYAWGREGHPGPPAPSPGQEGETDRGRELRVQGLEPAGEAGSGKQEAGIGSVVA